MTFSSKPLVKPKGALVWTGFNVAHPSTRFRQYALSTKGSDAHDSDRNGLRHLQKGKEHRTASLSSRNTVLRKERNPGTGERKGIPKGKAECSSRNKGIPYCQPDTAGVITVQRRQVYFLDWNVEASGGCGLYLALPACGIALAPYGHLRSGLRLVRSVAYWYAGIPVALETALRCAGR